MKRKGLFTILCILTIFCFSCKGQMNSNEEEEIITYYTVWFDTRVYGYISGSQSQIVQEGGYAYIPETPIPYTEYSEYIFDGWYTDEECSNPFDFNSPITSNITLYAKWKSDMASVKISFAESSDISISKSTNDSFITLMVLTSENNNFIWRIDGIKQEEATNSLIIDTRNLTRGTHAVSVVVILSDNSYKSAMIYITVEE